jgi:citrate lyase subunit beta/citryl-CoA lyase
MESTTGAVSDGPRYAGEAGERGPRVRSDCWIGYVSRESGGIEIHLQSLVDGYYGESIRTQLREGCAALGVEHAQLFVEDGGAYPFVLAARLETALRRGGATGSFLPPMDEVATYAPVRERFRRSRLYLPGNSPKYLLNAGLHRPDAVILDLEDSVAPGEKDAARLIVRNALRQVDFGGAERMVRINQGELGLIDVDEVVPHNVHLVLIPKVECAEDVRVVDERIRQTTADPVLLMPIIESARGVLNAGEIASASSNAVALTIGLEDYTADLGVQRTEHGAESLFARSMVVNAAKANGLQAIDSVYSDVQNREGLLASIREAKALGFEGKGCIHPRQIELVHQGFAPEEAEVERACRIVLAFREAEARGLGVVSLGSKMIDPPVVKRAQTTVALALATGQLSEDWDTEAGDSTPDN